jgi:short-subunit dehydrogenase
MKQLALITGASSGIGKALAYEAAAQQIDLILVARNGSKLIEAKIELERKFGISVHVIVKDLSNPEAAKDLHQEITAKGLQVNMLVNNAGVGLYGEFVDTPLETELSMIDLNVSSLVVLTKLFAIDMKKRGEGRIMNVASLLSFLPFPYYSVYSATKAFVLAFTETVGAELDGTGVIVTSICPGPVDTNFTTAEMLGTNAYKTNKPAEVSFVAKIAIRHLLHGKGNKVIGFNNWFISNLPRVTPDAIMVKIKKNLASQVKQKE